MLAGRWFISKHFAAFRSGSAILDEMRLFFPKNYLPQYNFAKTANTYSSPFQRTMTKGFPRCAAQKTPSLVEGLPRLLHNSLVLFYFFAIRGRYVEIHGVTQLFVCFGDVFLLLWSLTIHLIHMNKALENLLNCLHCFKSR